MEYGRAVGGPLAVLAQGLSPFHMPLLFSLLFLLTCDPQPCHTERLRPLAREKLRGQSTIEAVHGQIEVLHVRRETRQGVGAVVVITCQVRAWRILSSSPRSGKPNILPALRAPMYS